MSAYTNLKNIFLFFASLFSLLFGALFRYILSKSAWGEHLNWPAGGAAQGTLQWISCSQGRSNPWPFHRVNFTSCPSAPLTHSVLKAYIPLLSCCYSPRKKLRNIKLVSTKDDRNPDSCPTAVPACGPAQSQVRTGISERKLYKQMNKSNDVLQLLVTILGMGQAAGTTSKCKTSGKQRGLCYIPAIWKILLSKALTLPLLKLSSLKPCSTLQFQIKHLLKTLHDSSWLMRKGHPLLHSARRGEKNRTCSKGGESVAKVLNVL